MAVPGQQRSDLAGFIRRQFSSPATTWRSQAVVYATALTISWTFEAVTGEPDDLQYLASLFFSAWAVLVWLAAGALVGVTRPWRRVDGRVLERVERPVNAFLILVLASTMTWWIVVFASFVRGSLAY